MLLARGSCQCPRSRLSSTEVAEDKALVTLPRVAGKAGRGRLVCDDSLPGVAPESLESPASRGGEPGAVAHHDVDGQAWSFGGRSATRAHIETIEHQNGPFRKSPGFITAKRRRIRIDV